MTPSLGQVSVFLAETVIRCLDQPVVAQLKQDLSHRFGHLHENSYCSIKPKRQNCELQYSMPNLDTQESVITYSLLAPVNKHSSSPVP